MFNHAHFLLRSGLGGIAHLMRRLLTGYAVSFNRRHRRHGQLFQNRYKSIICHHDSGSARTLLSQIFGTPQGAMRELRMIPDNIDKAPQQGIAHLPAAYLYPITAVAFHGIV